MESVAPHRRMAGLVRVSRVLLVVLVMDGILAAGFAGYAEYRYGDGIPDSESAPAVLFWADDDAMGDATRRTLDHGLDLYRQGTASVLVSVGGHRPSKHFNGAEAMDAVLEQADVPTGRRFHDRGSNDTLTNLAAARSIALDNGWKRLLLVSDPLHVMRMDRVLGHRLDPLEAVPAAYAYRGAEPHVTLGELWLRVHREWLAYLGYLLPEDLYRGVMNALRN